MKIRVLVENIPQEELGAEHGLSLLIEYKEKTYLLDAGQSGLFMDNAKALSVDLSKVEVGVLSHGHYDHAGGFEAFLEKNNIKIYAMKNIVGEYFSAKGGMHEIGVPKEVYPRYSENFVLVDSVTEINDDVYIVPHRTKGLEKIGERTGLFKKQNGEIIGDDFAHEASLVFDTKNGLVIFNSCSHGGICNIIEEVKEVFPNKNIKAFLGGLHMMGMKNGEEYCAFTDEEIQEITAFLEKEKVEKIYTGHCTGLVGFNKIKKMYGEDKVEYLSIGKEINI